MLNPVPSDCDFLSTGLWSARLSHTQQVRFSHSSVGTVRLTKSVSHRSSGVLDERTPISGSVHDVLSPVSMMPGFPSTVWAGVGLRRNSKAGGNNFAHFLDKSPEILSLSSVCLSFLRSQLSCEPVPRPPPTFSSIPFH